METYPIEYQGITYNLKKEQVRKLLEIGEFKGLDTIVKIELKNKDEKRVKIIDYSTDNPLHPADIQIPVEFKTIDEENNTIIIPAIEIDTFGIEE